MTGFPFKARSLALSSGDRLNHHRRYFSFVSFGSAPTLASSGDRSLQCLFPPAGDRYQGAGARG